LKNLDIITAWEKINITDTINKKTIWKDSETIVITISDVEETTSVVEITIDINPGLTSCGFNIKVVANSEEETQELFNIEWDISASLSEKTLRLNPNFVLTNDSLSADVKLGFESNKIENYKFDTPEDAQDLNEIIGSLLWWEEYLDDEDYVYSFDEEWEDIGDEEIEDGEIEEETGAVE
jgi:hypothetical protein